MLEYEDSPEAMLASFEKHLGHAISEQLTAYLIDLYMQSRENAS